MSAEPAEAECEACGEPAEDCLCREVCDYCGGLVMECDCQQMIDEREALALERERLQDEADYWADLSWKEARDERRDERRRGLG